jgi:hypothetical protein
VRTTPLFAPAGRSGQLLQAQRPTTFEYPAPPRITSEAMAALAELVDIALSKGISGWMCLKFGQWLTGDNRRTFQAR